MSMRARQKLPHFAPYGIVLPEVQTNDATGESSIAYVNQSDIILPDIENYDLKTMLEAGVDLKQVNTKILPATELETHVTIPSKVDDKE